MSLNLTNEIIELAKAVVVKNGGYPANLNQRQKQGQETLSYSHAEKGAMETPWALAVSGSDADISIRVISMMVDQPFTYHGGLSQLNESEFLILQIQLIEAIEGGLNAEGIEKNPEQRMQDILAGSSTSEQRAYNRLKILGLRS